MFCFGCVVCERVLRCNALFCFWCTKQKTKIVSLHSIRFLFRYLPEQTQDETEQNGRRRRPVVVHAFTGEYHMQMRDTGTSDIRMTPFP